MKKVLLLTMALVIASCSKQDDNTTEILNISQEKVLSDDEIFELFDFDMKGTTVSTSRNNHNHHENWMEWLFTAEGTIVVSEVEGRVWSLTNTDILENGVGRIGTVEITNSHLVRWDGSSLIYPGGRLVRVVSENQIKLYDRIFGINQTLDSKYVKNLSPERVIALINDGLSDNGRGAGDYTYSSSGYFEGFEAGRYYTSDTCFGNTIQLVFSRGYVSKVTFNGQTYPYSEANLGQIIADILDVPCYTEAEAVILSALQSVDAGFYLPSSGSAFVTSTCTDLTVTINDYTNADAWSVNVSWIDSNGSLNAGLYNSNQTANIIRDASCNN